MCFRFHAKHTRVQSFWTMSRPRVRNWRKLITELMRPKTGSTRCLSRSYAARPSPHWETVRHARNRGWVFRPFLRFTEALGPMVWLDRDQYCLTGSWSSARPPHHLNCCWSAQRTLQITALPWCPLYEPITTDQHDDQSLPLQR